MFGLMFSVLVIIGLLSTAFHIAMRIRLLRMDAAKDRIEWLSFRSSTEVMDTYQALFPRSVLATFEALGSTLLPCGRWALFHLRRFIFY